MGALHVLHMNTNWGRNQAIIQDTVILHAKGFLDLHNLVLIRLVMFKNLYFKKQMKVHTMFVKKLGKSESLIG